ncbi:MAG: serine hydrolase [Bacteroidota bacterium]
MKNIPSLLLVPFFLLSCQKKEQPEQKYSLIRGEIGQRLDSLLTPFVEELRAQTDNEAGLAIGVTQGDQIVYAQMFGYANLKKGIKADFHTLFHTASLSKPFTAAAIVKLIQAGKLTLEDRLIDHIPEFKMKGEGHEKITLKDILTHRSGIPRHLSSNDWEYPTFGPNALEKNLKQALDFELDFEPASQYNYSNSAFDILGIVISRASRMSFEDYVKEAILLPAGMNESTFIKDKDSLPANWADAHSYALGTQNWSPFPYTENQLPSSCLHTSLMDMCTWGMLHVHGGKVGEIEVFDKKHFDLFISPHGDTPWGDKIALSWFLQSYLDRPIIMHTGSDSGFEAMTYIYPADSISIVILANRDFSRTGRIINATSEVIFKQAIKDYSLSARYRFAESYLNQGLDSAKSVWEDLRNDTTDMYYVDDDDILTTGAVLEKGELWKEAQEILEYYISMDSSSTYAWRLLGNTHLKLGARQEAKSCYEQALNINPDYEKAKKALKDM